MHAKNCVKVAKGDTKYKRDLVIMSEKTRVHVGDLKDIHTVKVKIDHRRKECLRLRIKQEFSKGY